MLILLLGYTWLGQQWKLAHEAANCAEKRNCRKYAFLAEAHQFEPIAVETMGVYGECTGVIIRAIGRRLVEVTGEPREANWFRQNLAIGIQRGNAFSILNAYLNCRAERYICIYIYIYPIEL